MFAQKLKLCQSMLDKCQSNRKNSHIYYRLFETQLNNLTRELVVEKFWSHFQDQDKCDSKCHQPFLEAMEFLKDTCNRIDTTFSDNKHQALKEKFFLILKTQILSQKPYQLNDFLKATYTRAFRTFLNLEKAKEQNDTSVKMEVIDDCDMETDDYYDDINDLGDSEDSIDRPNKCFGCSCCREECECRLIYDKFCKVNEYIREFNLLEGLVGNTAMTISKIFIKRRVASKGDSNYSYSYLDELIVWVQDVVKPWITGIYGLSSESDIDSIGQKLNQFLKDVYAEIRVSQLFDIIVEFPNSEAAIHDLRICLEQSTSSEFRLNLIDSVKQSFIESLLDPGVRTYDILNAYISAIKALRALDPTGLILQLVTEPVRQYLKSRDDTVRCIVTALTDEDHNSELNREMIRSGAQTNENGLDGKSGTVEISLPSEGEKCTALNFELWKPDPIKLSSSDDLMKSSRFSDIVSILVNIYETKDLFVEEYQKLLSQRLLSKYDECNLDTELRNLELLTIRFSDCELHRCEVMLKDVQTSKRINKRILSGDIREHKLDGFKNLDVLIVSSPFWPDKFSPMASLSEEPPEINFPPEIESAISTYTKAFEAIQASRTLHWRHHLGSVNMDLTINGKTQNFTVSPVHAAILYLFKDKKSWRLSELMHKTSLPAATIRSRLALWQRNGLIRDRGEDRYVLIIE